MGAGKHGSLWKLQLPSVRELDSYTCGQLHHGRNILLVLLLFNLLLFNLLLLLLLLNLLHLMLLHLLLVHENLVGKGRGSLCHYQWVIFVTSQDAVGAKAWRNWAASPVCTLVTQARRCAAVVS